MKTNTNFWDLLGRVEIVVPIIQRDYAQGREDDKIQDIRTKFVSNLLEMVSDEKKSTSLDFIYGRILKRSHSDEPDKKDQLILLDGQQRLTTLYLLHWYLLSRASGEDEFIQSHLEQLSHFSYHTRLSAKIFSEALCSRVNFDKFNNADDNFLPSHHIKNQTWFHSIWLLDPTVDSMLRMLDEIDKQYKAIDRDKPKWSKLINSGNPPVTFQFLNMDEFTLTDELYVRMNARGKSLTQFEDFKAEFLQFCEGLDVDKDIPEKIDNSWSQIFWNLAEKKEQVDEHFMRFFNLMSIVSLAKKALDAKKVDIADKSDALVGRWKEDLDKLRGDGSNYVSFDVYKKYLIKDRVKEATTFLDWGADTKLGEYLKILKNESIGFLQIVEFVAIFSYVTNEHPDDSLEDWLRVSVNIIRNTIIDSQYDLLRGIKFIRALLGKLQKPFSLDKLAELDAADLESIKLFDGSQLSEERLKAKLIAGSNDDEWEKAILEAEKHDYFYKQIGFLLEMSKQEDSTYSLEYFRENYKIASELFTEKLVESDKFFLQRALLCEGNYLIKKGPNHSFCEWDTRSARYRNENWRNVYNPNPNNPNSPKVFNELITKLRKDKDPSISKRLENVINGGLKSNFPPWRKVFVEYPEAIEYCSKRQIRFEPNIENPSGDIPLNKIILLKGTRKSGEWISLLDFYVSKKLKDEYSLIPANKSDGAVKFKKKDDETRYKLKEKFIEDFIIGDSVICSKNLEASP